MQIEEQFEDRRIAYKSKKYLICRSKNCLQIEELFADERTVCRSKKYLICRSKKYLWIEEVFDLQIEELHAG